MAEKFVIPREVVQLANTLHERMREENEVAEQREQIENERRNKETSRKRAAGLAFAEEIFIWALLFRESAEGKKLIEVGHPTLFSWHETGIFLFDGDIKGTSWRAIGIGEKGVWWLANGCGSRPVHVTSPEELAEQVDTKILKQAVAWLEDGRVWECIKRIFAN